MKIFLELETDNDVAALELHTEKYTYTLAPIGKTNLGLLVRALFDEALLAADMRNVELERAEEVRRRGYTGGRVVDGIPMPLERTSAYPSTMDVGQFTGALDPLKVCGARDNCKRPKEESHTCPYSEDVNSDTETMCECCNECRAECAADI